MSKIVEDKRTTAVGGGELKQIVSLSTPDVNVTGMVWLFGKMRFAFFLARLTLYIFFMFKLSDIKVYWATSGDQMSKHWLFLIILLIVVLLIAEFLIKESGISTLRFWLTPISLLQLACKLVNLVTVTFLVKFFFFPEDMDARYLILTNQLITICYKPDFSYFEAYLLKIDRAHDFNEVLTSEKVRQFYETTKGSFKEVTARLELEYAGALLEEPARSWVTTGLACIAWGVLIFAVFQLLNPPRDLSSHALKCISDQNCHLQGALQTQLAQQHQIEGHEFKLLIIQDTIADVLKLLSEFFDGGG